MRAFAVKHNAKKRKSIVSTLEDVKQQPFSFTNNGEKAKSAVGCNIYVIETNLSTFSKLTIYKLAYRYRAGAFEKGSFCDGDFHFKNMAHSSVSIDGVCFDSPVRITSTSFIEWYKEMRGMVEISKEHIDTLERIIQNSANNAKPF